MKREEGASGGRFNEGGHALAYPCRCPRVVRTATAGGGTVGHDFLNYVQRIGGV